MKRITLGMVGVLVALSQAGTDAQGAKPPQLATDITAAEVQAVIKAPTGGGDRQMKVVDMGKYNVSVGVLRRAATKPGAPVGAINHEHVTEVYYIISGSGTLLTGGTVEGAKPLPADGEIVKIAVGPSNQGTFKQAAATSTAEVMTALEQSLAKAKEILNGLDDATITSSWSMKAGGKTIMTMPRLAVVRSILLNHWYHHRGQLSVYLRELDVPLPSIYGPTADENPFA